MPTQRTFTPPEPNVIETMKFLMNYESPNHDSFRDAIWFLADRWDRESEYEDLNDYRRSLCAAIPNHLRSTVTISKMYRRPFGCLVHVGRFGYRIKCQKSGRFVATRVH